MSKVKIYTTSSCPYCENAKRLFKQLNISFEDINLDNQQKLRQQLSQEQGGWRTVPMIFINEQFIGGFTELSKLYKDGKLLAMVGK